MRFIPWSSRRGPIIRSKKKKKFGSWPPQASNHPIPCCMYPHSSTCQNKPHCWLYGCYRDWFTYYSVVRSQFPRMKSWIGKVKSPDGSEPTNSGDLSTVWRVCFPEFEAIPANFRCFCCFLSHATRLSCQGDNARDGTECTTVMRTFIRNPRNPLFRVLDSLFSCPVKRTVCTEYSV